MCGKKERGSRRFVHSLARHDTVALKVVLFDAGRDRTSPITCLPMQR